MQCNIRKKEERKEKVERGRSLGTFAVLVLVLGFAGREGLLDNHVAEIDELRSTCVGGFAETRQVTL